MIYFHGTTDFQIDAKFSAVTLGKFDGVHIGHQMLMERALKHKEEDGAAAVVFAFNAHPENVLMTSLEQRDFVQKLGMDALVDCPFVPEISGMSPEQFIEEILVKRLHAKWIIVGDDFRFGHKRAGDVQFLLDNQERFGITVEVFEKEQYRDRDVSSTFIREKLAEGEMDTVRMLLGRAYSVQGTVLHGNHIGTKLGMPTLNLIPPREKLLPPNGVYMSRTKVDGKWYNGVTNIGYKPTVGADFRGVETYLMDFSQDIYGKEVRTELLSFERSEKKFASLERLKAQIEKDIALGRKYFQ